MKTTLPPAMTMREFRRRFKRALAVPFNFKSMCSPALYQVICSNACTIGWRPESLFFPLLTCCASCMGVDTTIEVTPNWQEPAILWTILASQPVPKQQNVLSVLQRKLLDLHQELNKAVYAQPNQKPKIPPVVEYFDMDSLRRLLVRKHGQALILSGSFEDLQKSLFSLSQAEVPLLEKLYDGAPLLLNCAAPSDPLNRSCVNIATYSNVEEFYPIFGRQDPISIALCSYFLSACFEENQYKLTDMLAIAKPTVELNRIFRIIIDLHQSVGRNYKLHPDAYRCFAQIHDEMIERSKNAKIKAFSLLYFHTVKLLLRLACVIHIIEGVVSLIVQNKATGTIGWSLEIQSHDILQARKIADFVLRQKMILLEDTIKPLVANTSKPTTPVKPAVPPQPMTRSSPTTSPRMYPNKTRTAFAPTVVPFNNMRELHNPSVRSPQASPNVITFSNLSSVLNAVQPQQPPPLPQVPNVSIPNLNSLHNISLTMTNNGTSVTPQPTILNVMSVSGGMVIPSETMTVSSAPSAPTATSILLPANLQNIPETLSISVVSDSADYITTSLNSPGTVAAAEDAGAAVAPVLLPPPIDNSAENDNENEPPSPSESPAPDVVPFSEPQEEFIKNYRTIIRNTLLLKENIISTAKFLESDVLNDSEADEPSLKKMRYTSSTARHFLRRISDLGLGKWEVPPGSSIRKGNFVKKPVGMMDSEEKAILKELEVAEEDYKDTFEVDIPIISFTKIEIEENNTEENENE